MKHGQQHVIDDFAARAHDFGTVEGMACMTRTRLPPGSRHDLICDGKCFRAAQAYHADTSRAGRRGKGANRVVILGRHAGIIPGRIEQGYPGNRFQAWSLSGIKPCGAKKAAGRI